MRNRTLLDIVRSMMSYTDLPISMWGYALQTVCYLLNRISSKSVSTTPYEIWNGQLVHFGRNRHSRVNSAPITRPRAQPSVRHRARARARVRAVPVTAREFLLPSQQASARPPSASHVLPHACMHACARDAPNVCSRICALVNACPSARHHATKRLPAHPKPPRTPDTVTARLVVYSKPSRVHYRPSKGSTESPDSLTLPRLFPRIPRLGQIFST
ncbi:hypothetical protein CRG98_039599 [Punica granatum]|uniref:Integrase catalytic domain-containing protein n=1 Tax=Punica granatum TaxID=22663 RepID=A0A2I0I7P9_PUNGR|nr:hypothetical protein CRG98_039599 [Punica granatum]